MEDNLKDGIKKNRKTPQKLVENVIKKNWMNS